MATIDQQFVEYIVKNLVSQPEDVKIDRTIDEKGVLLTLTVADEDLGRRVDGFHNVRRWPNLKRRGGVHGRVSVEV